MLEYQILLTASTALLLILLLHHHRGMRTRIGASGFWLLLLGALVPLLDLPWRYLTAADRIAFLDGTPLFYSLYPALLLIGSVSILAAWAGGIGTARRVALGLSAGFALHLLLVLLTPVGAYLFLPFSEVRVALPLFAPGHGLLAGMLVIALTLIEVRPAARPWLLGVTWALAGIYAAAAIGVAGTYYIQATAQAAPRSIVRIAPVNAWLTRWIVVREDDSGYHLRRRFVFERAEQEPLNVPRAEDDGDLATALRDPIVRRIYYRLFQFPVVQLTSENAHTTIVVRELADLEPPIPGPTLFMESDRSGSNRFYELKNFD